MMGESVDWYLIVFSASRGGNHQAAEFLSGIRCHVRHEPIPAAAAAMPVLSAGTAAAEAAALNRQTASPRYGWSRSNEYMKTDEERERNIYIYLSLVLLSGY